MSQGSNIINGFTTAEALDIFDSADLNAVKVRGRSTDIGF